MSSFVVTIRASERRLIGRGPRVCLCQHQSCRVPSKSITAHSIAQEYFRQGVDCAREPAALSWELRRATGLAQLWRDRGRTIGARSVILLATPRR